MLPQAFPQNYPGKTNTQLLLCAWESLPTQGSVCAAFVCSGMSRAAGFQAQGKTLPASKVPSQAFPPAFPKAVGLRGVCVWMDECQHSWAAAGMGGETPLKSFPAAAGTGGETPLKSFPAAAGHSWQGQMVPSVCPCAVTEAALPPHPALGRTELGCETKSSLYSLPESTKGCAWSYQPIVVSVSAWERSGFGE